MAGRDEREYGDRPAPAGLEPLRMFLDSDDRFRGRDHLASRTAFRAFAAQHLPGWPADLDEDALAGARTLRDAVRDAVLAGPGRPQEDRLAGLLTNSPVRCSLTAEGGRWVPRVLPVDDDPGAALVARVAGALLTAAADGTLAGLRECGRADCRWVYWAPPGVAAARWCSHDCGNVMKMRAYRERRRAG